MHLLPSSTIKLITSTQVITSAVSVVKELIENALDAGASSIEIKLENYGLEKVEVRDNGSGIPKADVIYMAQPHYTSKLSCTDDLDSLLTYGFRGEALGSLCAVSDVKITTKTASEDISREYELDHKGQVIKSKPSHVGQGTTVLACNLFKNIPVRKQYHNNSKRKKEILKSIEDLVVSYGIICHNVRFALRHNKEVVWQKNGVSLIRQVLHSVLGSSLMNQLQHVQRNFPNTSSEIECFLPSIDSSTSETGKTSTEKTYIYINCRPVVMKELEKMLKQHFSTAHSLDVPKYPVGVVSIKLPSKEVDVNVDPNKTLVMIHNKEEVLENLEEILKEIYKSTTPESNNPPLPSVPDLSETENTRTVTPDRLTNSENLSSSVDVSTTVMTNVTEQSDICDLSLEDIFTNEMDEAEFKLENSTVCLTDGPQKQDLNVGVSNDVRDTNITDVPNIDDESLVKVNKEMREQSDISTVGVPNGYTCIQDGNLQNSTISDSTIEPVLTSTYIDAAENVAVSGNGMEFNVSGEDLDELIAMDIDTPVKATVSSDNCFNTADSKGVNITEWSKGTALTNKENMAVQPVRILVPGGNVSNSSAGNTSESGKFLSKENPTLKSRSINDSVSTQATLYDMVNEGNIKKPSTAYIYFSKHIRQQVVEENPGSSFQDIARLIGQKWNSLSENEKEKYEQLRNEDVKRYKLQKQQMSSPTDALCQSKIKPVKKKRKIDETHSRLQKSVTVNFKVTDLKKKIDLCQNGISCSQKWDMSNPNLHLIGQVPQYMVWAGSQDNKIVLFQPIRAKESLIYRRLMETHEIPKEKLETPILLMESILKELNTLLGLNASPESSHDPYLYFTDVRLVKNGFKIRKIISADDTCPRIEIVEMTRCMSWFGVDDLEEILRAIKIDRSAPLYNCRPIKIQHYLQAEAVRMSRQLPPNCTKRDCMEILEHLMSTSTAELDNISRNCCFHNKPFLVNVYDMNELPGTQYSQLSEEAIV